MSTPDPGLAAMVRGRSDPEVLAMATLFGGPATLTAQFLNGLASGADASALTAPLVVGYRVATPESNLEHTVSFDPAGCRADAAPLASAGATISLSFPDLVRLIVGVLDLPTALGDGRVVLTGPEASSEHVLALHGVG